MVEQFTIQRGSVHKSASSFLFQALGRHLDTEARGIISARDIRQLLAVLLQSHLRHRAAYGNIELNVQVACTGQCATVRRG